MTKKVFEKKKQNNEFYERNHQVQVTVTSEWYTKNVQPLCWSGNVYLRRVFGFKFNNDSVYVTLFVCNTLKKKPYEIPRKHIVSIK